ncbi:Vegetative incompatibility protein [Paramyrothecium foliicola]|nr:Vegetative incompatibility protein [Paramyrothecium foliicola]
MEGLGAAASVIAVVDLSAKIASICSQYIKDVKNAESNVRRLLQEINSLATIAEDIKNLLRGPHSARLKSSQKLEAGLKDSSHKLRTLEKKLEGLEQKLRPGGTRHKIKARLGLTALRWPLSSQEVDKDVDDIARYTQTLSLALQQDHLAISLNTDQVVVLDRLPIAKGASFNSLDEESNPTCLNNTRVELLDQISTWIHDPSAKALFWLNGMAGTGKSTISRTIARSLSETNHLGASFFFKRGEADRGNATKFMTTIARLLADREPRLAPILMSTIEKDSTISGSATQEQFQKLIFEPLSKITLSCPLVLIVDALDECEGDDKIKTIIHLFTRIQSQQTPWLKVFMTSRPDLPIRLGFSKAQGTYQDFILHEIRSGIIEHDISIFLEHQFRSIRDDYNLTVVETPLPLDWPGEPRMKALVDLAKPLFISAATACRFISEPSHGHPDKLLEEILAYKGKSATSGLDATYLPILNRQIVGIQSKRKKEEVVQQLRKLVGIIITLESPLSSSALAGLLNIPQVIIVDQLKMLHSVLQVPMSSKDPIRLFHLSFRDFLVDPETRTKTPLWIDEKQMHQDIVVHCLRIMNEKLRRDMCDLGAPGIARSDIDQQTVTNHIQPELEYACLYWVDHLKKGDIHISGDALYLFLSSHLLHWIEALSLVGRASDSLGILRTLRSVLQPEETQEIPMLLDDAIRFSVTYLSTINPYPLQIYALIAFLPLKSHIRKVFLASQWDLLSISGVAEQKWDSCLQTLEGHSGTIYSVAFSPDAKYLTSASSDKTVRVWDTATSQCLQTLEGHNRIVNSVVFSSDIKYLALASWDKTIRLWDAKTGQCLEILEGHSGAVYSIVFSPDRKRLASASSDETIRLWDADTYQHLQTLEGHSGAVYSLAFSPDGKRLASASQDRTIRFWDADTGHYLQTLEGHRDKVRSVVFSPDTKGLASTSSDKTIQLWDTETGLHLQTLEGHSLTVHSVAFSPDAKHLASASWDKTIRLWDAKTGQCLEILEAYSGAIYSIAFSPDGKRLASASDDQTVRLWDIPTCQYLQTPEAHSGAVRSVIFSPGAKCLASASDDTTVRLWDTVTSQCLQILKGHSDAINSIVFSPDAKYLASASDDQTIRLWDTATGQCLQTLKGYNRIVNSVVFSSDIKYLASASWDKTIRLWDTKTGQCLEIFEGHSGAVYSIAFSPDRKRLASASSDETIRLWDVVTGQSLQKLDGHRHRVISVVFSPDAMHLASSSYDKTVRLWDAATGQCLRIFNNIPTSWLLFTPEGSHLSTDAGILEIESNQLLGLPPNIALHVNNPSLPRQTTEYHSLPKHSPMTVKASQKTTTQGSKARNTKAMAKVKGKLLQHNKRKVAARYRPKRRDVKFKIVEPRSDIFYYQQSPFQPSGSFAQPQTLDVSYSIRPYSTWRERVRYRHFVLEGVKYSLDDFVYVRNETSRDGIENSPDDCVENFWVARILEIRAQDKWNISLRVFWMYSPDDIPSNTLIGSQKISGRQFYHEPMELLASNHMDVIDVRCVVKHVSVKQLTHYRMEAGRDALFWRQAYNIYTKELSSIGITTTS